MNEWQPIASAPKDGTRVRLWNGQEHIGWWFTTSFMPPVNQLMYWTDGNQGRSYYGPNSITDVTHWQPCSSGPGKGEV